MTSPADLIGALAGGGGSRVPSAPDTDPSTTQTMTYSPEAAS